MDIITLEHVTKSFDGQKILEDFNLSVREGEFLTVIGRSGCGKTTMLKLMNGLLTPDRGKVYVEGKNIAETDMIFFFILLSADHGNIGNIFFHCHMRE